MEDKWQELEPLPKIPLFFRILRILGMGIIVLSAVFLALKDKAPVFKFENYALSNGALGQLMLLSGGILFGIYFFTKLIYSLKSK